MSKQTEAMKLALGALELGDDASLAERDTAITALREALASEAKEQPRGEATLAQQSAERGEPVATVESVATVTSESGNPNVLMSWWHEPALPVGTKLYTSPQAQPRGEATLAREPLTEEQREVIAKGWRGRNWTVGDIIDATEAAHGITVSNKT